MTTEWGFYYNNLIYFNHVIEIILIECIWFQGSEDESDYGDDDDVKVTKNNKQNDSEESAIEEDNEDIEDNEVSCSYNLYNILICLTNNKIFEILAIWFYGR